MMTQNVCVPMKLDAFRLNLKSCDGPSRLAPITQPNYSLLDVSQSIHHDVLDHIDLHDTARGPNHSDRVTDLATGKPRSNRLGIYLHWMLPRFYRSGIAATQSAENKIADKRKWHGFPAVTPSGAAVIDSQSPTFRPIPNRWLVIRYLRSKFPIDASIPTYQAFVVESDRLWNINDFGPKVDLEIDASPFINPDSDHQGETFIGKKTPLEIWQEGSEKKVPISVLSGANPLFADYQPHNTNVLSIVDNFTYGQEQYLEKATADYFVVGWHSDQTDDPFHFQSQSPEPTVADRLNSCMMKLADFTRTGLFDPNVWLKGSLSSRNVRVAVHGSIYGVEWDKGSLPDHVPANSAAELFKNDKPVSIGATPLDALIAIAHAHNVNPKAGERPIERDLLSLQTLVIKSEDDVDSQFEAADILYDQNFTPSDGGQQWHISATPRQDGAVLGSQRPVQPTKNELLKLEEINAYQMSFDLHKREVKWLQWALWAKWWKYVSAKTKPISPEKDSEKVIEMSKKLGELIGQVNGLRVEINRRKEAHWEPSAAPRFYMAKDPSILLSGLENGWPTDYVDLLKVRIDRQLESPARAGFLYHEEDKDNFRTLRETLRGKVPNALRDTISNLVLEFDLINPYKQQPLPSPGDIIAQATQVKDYQKLQPSEPVLPLYYDQGPITNGSSDGAGPEKWRNRWNGTQAWFPLFVEWQVEYVHVEAKEWTVTERGAYGPPNLRYQVNDFGSTNTRTISGRTMVSPKPLQPLKNNLELLFKSPSEDKSGVTAEFDKLKFIALSMSDFTDHLLTIHQGTHVKPHVRAPGCMPVPTDAAVTASSDIMNKSDLALIGSETRGTPYGDSLNFTEQNFSPFIPVTHGRFKFTKLNIIDKFGQVISAIDPAPLRPPPLRPYISEIFQCDKASQDDSQWMQIGHRINQESRLNSHFVVWDNSEERRGWRPTTEYDNPIWGWLVVDFVGFGIQIFLPDGRFYREIHMGGPVGTSQGQAWLPFKHGEESIPAQLKQLITRLQDATYLEAFFGIVSNSLQHMKSPPNQYAHFFPAIVGKPFALVNAGFSLELSHPPCENQSTTIKEGAVTAPPLESYKFQVKLGDKERVHDGLVLYFERKPAPSHDIDIDRIFTYFPEQGVNNSQSTLIKPSNYPRFTPYFMPSDDRTPMDLVKEYNSKLQVFGILADPFIAVHAYSGILPVRELKLPPWAVEQSLKNITAFFKLGPLIIPRDIPAYDPQHVLQDGSDLPKDTSQSTTQTPPVLIPSIATADWDWLQPHVVSSNGELTTHYNALPVACPDSRVKFEPTPYTAIEGYLHLKRPITPPKSVPA